MFSDDLPVSDESNHIANKITDESNDIWNKTLMLKTSIRKLLSLIWHYKIIRLQTMRRQVQYNNKTVGRPRKGDINLTL